MHEYTPEVSSAFLDFNTIDLEHWKLLVSPLPNWIYMGCLLGLFHISCIDFMSVNISNSLVLMTYLNTILALSGYQADEQRLLREVQDIVSRSA